MKESNVRFTPKFVLKNIDPKEIMKDYLEGKYENIELPTSRIKFSDVFHITTPGYGSSPEEARYQFKDKNNTSIVIVTSNCRDYDIFKRASHFGEGGRCDWCKRDFDNEPVRIPIRKEEFKKSDKTYYFFWCEDECCDFSCALAHTIRESYRDHLYKCAEDYLRLLFRLCYPGEVLVKAPCFRLYKGNKGPLNDEEYKKQLYKYRRTTNVILFPAKVEYIQEQIA